MPEEYLALVAAMKALTKEATTSEQAVTLKVAEDGWDTRPDAESYGIISLEFEAGHMDGDNRKQHRAYEGSIDLYSRNKHGNGWVQLIEQVLTEHCDSTWSMNRPGYESNTKLYHFEWIFQIEG